MGAQPSGAPGWPLFAFCTASTARNRRALIDSWSRSLINIVTPLMDGWGQFGDRGRIRPDCLSTALDDANRRTASGGRLQSNVKVAAFPAVFFRPEQSK